MATKTKKLTKKQAGIKALTIAIGLLQASITNGEIFEDDPPEVIVATEELLLKMRERLKKMRTVKPKSKPKKTQSKVLKA